MFTESLILTMGKKKKVVITETKVNVKVFTGLRLKNFRRNEVCSFECRKH